MLISLGWCEIEMGYKEWWFSSFIWQYFPNSTI